MHVVKHLYFLKHRIDKYAEKRYIEYINQNEKGVKMFLPDKVKIDDIIFVNHLIGNKKDSFTKFNMSNCTYYQLLYKLSGEAVITFHDKTVTEKADDIRFTPRPPKGRTTNYTALVKEEGESINIGFTTESPLPEEIFTIKGGNNLELKELFQKLQKIWYYKRDGYYYESLSLMYRIFAKLQQENARYAMAKSYQIILPAINYIDEHFTDIHIECEDLAKRCEISHVYLSKLFNRHFGVSPNKYILIKKLEYACDLLNDRTYKVTKVAKLCGFSNEYYFSKTFKKHFGVSPSVFTK